MSKLSLLLTAPAATLRWQVAKAVGADEQEISELETLRHYDPLLKSLLAFQSEDGSFMPDKRTATTSVVQATALALTKLHFLGFDKTMPEVRRAADYLLEAQRADGSWPYHKDDAEDAESYDRTPLQAAYPLWGLSSVGYAWHPQVEKGFDWLFSLQLEDGAWPVGIVSGNHGYIAGYRKLPNTRKGCRVNTTCSLLAVSYHEERREDDRVRKAVDMLLGRQTFDRHCLGYNAARNLGIEPSSGFFSYFAHHDLALIADLVGRLGGGLSDSRVDAIVGFLEESENPMGLWEYEGSPIVTHWLTWQVTGALELLKRNAGWVSIEPGLPFNAYKKGRRRF